MDRDERQQLRAITGEVAQWASQAQAIKSYRAKTDSSADEANRRLRGAIVNAVHDGESFWRILPLGPGRERDLGDLARQYNLPPISSGEGPALADLAYDTQMSLRAVRALVGARRLISGGKRREAGTQAAEYLRTYHDQALAAKVPDLLRRLAPQSDDNRPVSVADALASWVGLAGRLADRGAPQMLPVASTDGLARAVAVIAQALEQEASRRAAALQAGENVRKREVRRVLSKMPVERIKEVTRDRLRIGPLTSAGITTVQAVLDRGSMLQYLSGLGATSASRLQGAAYTIQQATFDEMPIRLDIKNRTPEAADLLRRLRAWDALRKSTSATADLAAAEALTPLTRALHNRLTHIIVCPGTRSAADFSTSVGAVRHRASQMAATIPATPDGDPWDDFLQRPADYFALLCELGFNNDDEQKTHGDLPDDIVEAVRACQLDTEHLTASLRGYQSFASRFALVQRKVIIGDEMGLGKTVEALAVLAHLRTKGSHYSLVICPAAVVTNWIREIQSKSTLRPLRLHGPGRDAAARSWLRSGGVAVTTFDTLRWFEDGVGAIQNLSCVVVDEAHYIKNPAALRTRRTATILRAVDRAILLTGTPLENRIQEFRNLISYIRPDLVVDDNEFAPRRFRRQVAPAYLRRNQEDVLTELPELVEIDEWLPMSAADNSAYRSAVASGNFMAMRQAAMSQGGESEKLQRLTDIVQEAEDNGRRVIVYSHFRNVLDQVANALPGKVFGPLTGSVPAAARQVMVDRFSSAAGGAVLVSQIVAGGVGLNIQAASVVIICEPQLKPTTEWQAIARAHRMGQLQSVQVHRLLSEEGVDLRVNEILAAKRELFDEFARISETADSAPEAYDLSEADIARDVIAAERERLFSDASRLRTLQDEATA